MAEQSRKKVFLERWALLNLALLVTTFMSVMGYFQNSNPITELRGNWQKPLVLDLLLVWFPLNGIYVVGSLNCHVTQAWHEHRFTWMVVLVLGVAWALLFPGQVIRA